MCGRFALTSPPETVRAALGYADQPWFPPRFNIAPTQPIAIIFGERDGGGTRRRFALVRWGFVPAFVKDFSAFRPILNAWSESVADKPSFRNAVRRRRCLVPADGYYVWPAHDAPAQPWLVRRADGQPFALAGLQEPWAGADGSEVDTACIVTAPAAGPFAALHPRRPVIIAPEDIDLWLDPDETRTSAAIPLLDRPPGQVFEAVPIGTAVNTVANDRPDIQTPTGPAVPLPVHLQAHWKDAQGELF